MGLPHSAPEGAPVSLMQSPLVKYPVYTVFGLCLVGASPLAADLARAVVGAFGNTGGIAVGVAPQLPAEFQEGRQLVVGDGASAPAPAGTGAQ